MMNPKLIIGLLIVGALLAFFLWRSPAPAVAPAITAPVASAPVVPAPVMEPPPAAVTTAPAGAGGATTEPAAPTPAAEPRRPLAPGVVAIRDQKTLDFSSGKPVVKNDAAEKAAIDAALKEIEDATKDVTFGPNAGPPMAP